MEEKYTRFFDNSDNLFADEVSVAILQRVLTKHNETGKCLFQAKVQNVDPLGRAIHAINYVVTFYDPFNKKPWDEEHQLLDLNLDFGETAELKKVISNNTARSFEITVKEIIFTNGEVKAYQENNWENLGELGTLEEKFGKELAEQAKRDTIERAKYYPLYGKGMWLCTCGALNRMSDSSCSNCRYGKIEQNQKLLQPVLEKSLSEYEKQEQTKATYNQAVAIIKNPQAVSKEYTQAKNMLESIVGYEDTEDQLKACIDLENQAKKKEKGQKKNVRIVLVLAVVLVAAANILLLSMKEKNYNHALSLGQEGNYIEAVAIFEKFGGYKDSEIQLAKNQKNASEQKAQADLEVLQGEWIEINKKPEWAPRYVFNGKAVTYYGKTIVDNEMLTDTYKGSVELDGQNMTFDLILTKSGGWWSEGITEQQRWEYSIEEDTLTLTSTGADGKTYEYVYERQ